MDKDSLQIVCGTFVIIIGILLVFTSFAKNRKKLPPNRKNSSKTIIRGQALGYLFHNPNWIITTFLQSILLIFPLTAFVAFGYELKVMRDLSDDPNSTLPVWNDPVQMFVDGVRITLRILLVFAPAALILLVAIIPAVGSGISLYDFLLAKLKDSGPQPSLLNTNTEFFAFIVYLFILYEAICTFALPAYVVIYARNQKVAFKDWYRLIFNNLGLYLGVWSAISLVLAILAIVDLIPIIGPIIGPLMAFPGQFWLSTVIAHSFGQVYSLSNSTENSNGDKLAINPRI